MTKYLNELLRALTSFEVKASQLASGFACGSLRDILELSLRDHGIVFITQSSRESSYKVFCEFNVMKASKDLTSVNSV